MGKFIVFSLIVVCLFFSSILCSYAEGVWDFPNPADSAPLNADAAKDAKNPVTAVLNGELYAAWEETSGTASQIRVKRFNAAASRWESVDGGGINRDITKSANNPELVVCNNNLYAAWNELNGVYTAIRVKRYDGGTAWTSIDGGTDQGINRAATPASNPSFAVFNGELYLAWDQAVSGINHIYVKKYLSGSTWSSVDGNTDSGLNFAGYDANSPYLAVHNDKLYATWGEKNNSGIFQVRVRRYDGGNSWTFIDGNGGNGLNLSVGQHASDFRLASYHNNLYLAWGEIDASSGGSQVRLMRYDGAVWTFTGGGSMNRDPLLYAYLPAFAVLNNTLYLAWDEEENMTLTSKQQIRVKKYDGTSFTFIDGGNPTSLVNKNTGHHAKAPFLQIYNGDLYAAWYENDGTANQIFVKKLPLPAVTTSVAVPADNTYGTGKSLDFTVSFSKPVTVAGGTPYIPITLNTGGTVNAAYVSGSGTASLLFRYTVAAGNRDPDGISVGGSISLNGSSIVDSNNPADLNLNNIADAAGVLIDALAPTVNSLSPADNAAGVGTNDNLVMTFNKNMAKGTGNITIKKASDNTTVEQIAVTDTRITVSGTTVTINPESTLEESLGHYVLIDAAALKDTFGNGYAGIADTTSWNFTTIDSTPPEAPSVTGVSVTANTRPTWNWTPGSGGNGNYRYRLDNSDLSTGAAPTTLTSFTPLDPLADGNHTLYVQERDDAGNWSASGSHTTKVDTQSPTVTLSTPSNPTNVSPIPVTITFSKPVTGFGAEDIAVGNGAKGTLNGSGNTYSINITPSGQGAVTVDVDGGVAQDELGNGNMAASRLTIIYDTEPPADGSVSINGGAAYTNGRTVTLTLTATDASEMIISEDSGFTGAIYKAYASSANFELSSGDGEKTVYVKYKDTLGNETTELISDTITLDTAAPTVSLGSTAANPTNVSPIPVTITFSEAVSGFTAEDITVGNGLKGALNGSGNAYSINITAAGQGEVTVDVGGGAAQDGAGNGNTAAARLAITYDTLPPEGGSVSINGGAAYTNDTAVTLTLSAAGAAKMMVSGSSGFTGAEYEDYAPGRSFELSSGDGLKAVYVKFKDAAGNETAAAISDTIILDTQGPSVSLGSTAVSPTNASAIPVTIGFSEAVTGFTAEDIIIGNGSKGTLNGSGSAYSIDITPTAQGEVTVDIGAGAAQDGAGNGNTAASRLAITYDSLPPESGSVSINGGAAYTNDTAVTLTLSAADAVKMMISGNSGFAGAAYEDYATGKSFELSSGDGVKTVYVKFKDAAGNETDGTLSDTITLDTQRPSVSLGSTAPDPTNLSPIPVTITFSEAVTGFDINDISVENGEKSGFTEISEKSYTVDITPSGEGEVTVAVTEGSAIDKAGNSNTAALQLSRSYDSIKPTVILSAEGVSGPTNTTPIPVTITFSEDVTGFAADNITVGNGSKGTLNGSGSAYSIDITPTAQGEVTVDIGAGAAQDGAGNGNTAASRLAITYDSLPPESGSVSINGGAAYTNDTAVTLTLSAADAVKMMISGNSGFAGAAYEDYATGKSFELSSGDGVKTVYVKFKDAAGNETDGTLSDTITLDTQRPSVSLGSTAPDPTNLSPIPVTITFSEDVTGFTAEDIIVANGSKGALSGSGNTYGINITPTAQGEVTVDVGGGAAQDGAGNGNTAAARLTITYDTLPPENGSVTINGGAAFTNDILVTLTLSAVSAAEVMISENSMFTGAAYEAYNTSKSFSLSPGDGMKTVYVKYKDALGNETAETISDTILLDTQGPSVSLASTAASPTNVSPIPVAITFSEAVTGFTAEDITVGNGSKGALSGSGKTYGINITPSGQGEVTVDIGGGAAEDEAGNENTAAARLAITYDTLPPESGSISINGGAAYTSGSAVTLTLSANDALKMMTSEDSSFAGAAYEAYTTVKSFALSAGDGAKTVCVKFKDAAGNETTGTISDTIILDTHKPEVSLSSTAPNPTNTSPVPVTITFSELVNDFDETDIAVGNGRTEGFVSNGLTYTVDIVPSTQGAISVDIAAGAARDAAGNGNTAALQLVLVYDTEATTGGSISINGGAAYTNSRLVTLELAAADAVKMMVSEGRGFDGASYEDYAASRDFVLSPGDGVKKVYVKYMDSALNETLAEISDTIILDTQAPSVSLDSTAADPTNISPIPVTVTFSEAVADFDIDDLIVVNGTKSNFVKVSETAYEVGITPGEGLVTVDIAAGAAMDWARNANTAAIQLCRTYDGQAPTAVGLSPAAGAVNVGLNDNLAIAFSENVQKGTGSIMIRKASDGSIAERIDVSGANVTVDGATATIDPSAPLSFGTAYVVQIDSTAFKDVTGNLYAGIGDDSWSFTTVPPSSDADLSSLALSSGTLAFSAGTTSYAVNVPYSVSSVTVTATASGAHATLTVNGAATASGQASAPVSLTAGATAAISVVVTAQDGTTTKTYTINVTRASGGGGSGGNDDDDSDTASPPDIKGKDIIIDSGTSSVSTTKDSGKTVTTVTLDEKKLEERLNAAGSNATVVIPVNSGSDVVVGQLSGQSIKNMEDREAVLEINTGNISYTLPASEIDIEGIAGQLGVQAELGDIKVSVRIAQASQDTVGIVEDTANKNNYQVVVKPIDFEITCSSGDKTVSVSKFNGYVERTIAIPEGVDPSRITTGIVLNSDGSFSHVPTEIVMVNGRYYARINSLTNSTYSVIWNPKSFKDMEKHWARDDVDDMASRLIVGGVDKDSFAPDRDITRAEFAVILVKALGLFRPGEGKAAFSDVDKADWYYDAVSIAYENGLIAGYGKNMFKPEAGITREEAMVILSKAMKLAGLNANSSGEEAGKLLEKYGDGGKVSSWAKEAVAACLRSELLSGYNGLLTPRENITRAETASVVRRLLKKAALI